MAQSMAAPKINPAGHFSTRGKRPTYPDLVSPRFRVVYQSNILERAPYQIVLSFKALRVPL
jgi:hypothetical protein